MFQSEITKEELVTTIYRIGQEIFFYGIILFFLFLIFRRFYPEVASTALLWKIFIVLVITGPCIFLDSNKDHSYSVHL